MENSNVCVGDLVRINDEMLELGGFSKTGEVSGIVIDITSGDPDSIWVYHGCSSNHPFSGIEQWFECELVII